MAATCSKPLQKNQVAGQHHWLAAVMLHTLLTHQWVWGIIGTSPGGIQPCRLQCMIIKYHCDGGNACGQHKPPELGPNHLCRQVPATVKYSHVVSANHELRGSDPCSAVVTLPSLACRASRAPGSCEQ